MIHGASKHTSQGSPTSSPWTMKNGVYFVGMLGVVLRLHCTEGSFSCQTPTARERSQEPLLKATADDPIRLFDLVVGLRVHNGCVADLNPHLVIDVPKLRGCKVGTVVHDDIVGDPKPKDDWLEKFYFRSRVFGSIRLCLDPLCEFVDYHNRQINLDG
jgi:hypothetical protein